MRFSPTHELLHATYFGGASTYTEAIQDLAIQHDQVYLVGQTSKGSNVNTFFPLYNPGWPAWWQPVHGSAGFNDGFVTEFCYDGASVGVQEVERTGLQAWFDQQGTLQVAGLDPGKNVLELYTAIGQRVYATDAYAGVGAVQQLHHPLLPSGLYLLSVNGQRRTAVLKQP